MCIMFSNKATSVPRQNYRLEIIFQDIALIDIYERINCVCAFGITSLFTSFLSSCLRWLFSYLATVELTILDIFPKKIVTFIWENIFLQPALTEEVLCGCRPFHLLFENITSRMATTDKQLTNKTINQISKNIINSYSF